ncbi:MAG: magnesium chelatase subunit H [Firmicutes bacterium]|nr:magnesium chelatase subunit H [Bacillota bacterium]
MLRFLYVVAEAQLVPVLRRAAERLAQDAPSLSIALEGYTVDQLLAADREEIRRRLALADVFLGSMLNSEREVSLLRELFEDGRPPVTVVFTSQPELVLLSRVGPFDGPSLIRDRAAWTGLTRTLQQAGIDIPPSLPALMAMAPRLWARLGDALGCLEPYARAGLYWLNASPENARRMMLHLANHHPKFQGRFRPEPPVVFPEVALWHPRAGRRFFASYDEFRQWRDAALAPAEDRPKVGVVVFRQYVTGESHRHYDAVVEALEAEGLDVVAGFGGLSGDRLVESLLRPAGIDLLLNLTGFNLVGSMGRPRPDRAVELLQELDVPYLVPFPLLFQTESRWEEDPVGLSPMQTALQVVLPELEGAGEPRVFAAQGIDGEFEPLPEAVRRLARRVRRWIDLRRKPPGQRRIAITLFSFPPDKGSVGTAAYLDVFRSLHRLLSAMKAEGYNVEVPSEPEELRRLVLGADEALPGAPTVAVAGRLDTDEYRELVPAADRIAANFGPPPGIIDTDGRGLLVRGRQLGNVFVGVQPGFGYEGDPMRLLFARDASPSHSFAAYYAWLEHVWRADAVIHFGTHGALEFMPGKQVGLTTRCYPDMLIGELPHIYFYSMNNPSEATIAKRRSYATTVTYLSPPLAEAGLYRSLLSLKEAVAEFLHGDAGRGEARSPETLRALAEQAHLDQEVEPPRPGEPPQDYARRLAAYLRTLEERLIPVGLHAAGEPVSPQEAAEFLWAALQHPRPELGVPGLPHLVAAGMGLEWDALEDTDPRRDEVMRNARAIADRLAKGQPVPGGDPQWDNLIRFAGDFLVRLREEREIPALLSALSGRFIPPAPGGDPARTPAALPTGRNIHALDPHRIPSPAARQRAKPVVKQLLARAARVSGGYPETVAFVLWGTDNIKTHGEGVAQVLELLGVEPVPDSLGRMTRLRLIPLAELGRPRIDVVMTVSGIFRDIFPNVVELLDEAVRLAAEADEDPEMNFVRKHTLAIAAELNMTPAEASRRVFANKPGQYGTGVNHAVEASAFQGQDDLGKVFLHRKSFTYGHGAAGDAQADLLAACLKTCGAAFQNLDSTEIGLADVDHYYEYLGGLAAAARHVRGSAPPAFVADTFAPGARVRSLEEALLLETRTRLLNPRWYEGMLRHGYQGVHEIAARLDNTFGWSATAGAVPSWVYTAAADTFLLDDSMRDRMTNLNPQAVHRMAARLAEARDRGFWQVDGERWAKLQEILADAEDRVEGVV